MNERERPWSVPVALDDIPEEGRHFDLAADEATRAAVAAMAGVPGIPCLQASFDVLRHGRHGLSVTGTVTGEVDQICVVTLEPMRSPVSEAVDLIFAPPEEADLKRVEVEVEEDGPEPLLNGRIDLGAIATEFLILAIDPYPRRPGAVFESPAIPDDLAAHPFAALAALKRDAGQGS